MSLQQSMMSKTQFQTLTLMFVALLSLSVNVGAEPTATDAQGATVTTQDSTGTTQDSTGTVDHAELRALLFKGIEAGVTTVDQLTNHWGTPESTLHENEVEVFLYDIEPFKSVEVNVSDGHVLSLVIYLASPMLNADLAEQLQLNRLQTVAIIDENEEFLGVSYPERGVTFGFHPDDKDQKVAHMYLEPLAAEPFVLRVAADTEHQYEKGLRDLEIAIGLEPDYAPAHHLKAKLFLRSKELNNAVDAVHRAVELDTQNLEYRLTRARISMALGNFDASDEDVQFVLAKDSCPVHTQAVALLLRGHLALHSPNPNYHEAMSHHQRAIKIANPLVNDKRFAIRRSAKSTLVDAHAAVAKEIAFGSWKNKKETVPKWLDRAATIAEEFITHDQGDPLLRLTVSQEALATLTGIRHEVNPVKIADATIRRANKLQTSATDPIFKHHISWTLGKALLDVLRIEHARGQAESAKKYGEQAIEIFESIASSHQDAPEYSLLLGEAYFRMGSVYAVLLEDHTSAIQWYEKAATLLEKPHPTIRSYWAGQMGEWFVSMGVSYWELRERSRAIELTQFGVRFIEDALENKNPPQTSLEIPYSNLAHMYQQIGDDEQAKRFNELMSKAAQKHLAETTSADEPSQIEGATAAPKTLPEITNE